MPRSFSILFLILVTSCASGPRGPVYDVNDDSRVFAIYRSAFEEAFRAAWEEKAGGHICTIGIEESPDPRGAWARVDGYEDGQRAGRKARLAYERERAEKETH